MSTTPNLDLPEMAGNTFQPSVPYNEAMKRLDAIVVLVIEDMGLVTPPTTVSGDVGKRWIVPTGATGDWAGHATDIALCTAPGLWLFLDPGYAWRAWILLNNTTSLNKYYRFNGTTWVDDSAGGGVSEAPSDGKLYGRKNETWTEVPASGSGTVKSVNGESPDGSGNVALPAADVPYDHASSGLSATNVQTAIDQLASASPAAPSQSIVVACSDETTALTAGVAKVTFRNPYASAFTITHVKASLTTAQGGGSLLTVDINEAGTSILSTKLTIDNTEKTSETAATAAVVSDASIAADAEITVDIDQVGDGSAKGLKIYLIGHL